MVAVVAAGERKNDLIDLMIDCMDKEDESSAHSHEADGTRRSVDEATIVSTGDSYLFTIEEGRIQTIRQRSSLLFEA